MSKRGGVAIKMEDELAEQKICKTQHQIVLLSYISIKCHSFCTFVSFSIVLDGVGQPREEQRNVERVNCEPFSAQEHAMGKRHCGSWSAERRKT